MMAPPPARGASGRALPLPLLFLNAVGLRRTWDLQGYAGDALALLSGRGRAYGYHHVKRFLSDLAQAGAAGPLTDALAAWTTALWPPSSTADAPPPTFYIDGHRKPVYSDRLIRAASWPGAGPCSAAARSRSCTTPTGTLLATTDRGDTRLTASAPALSSSRE